MTVRSALYVPGDQRDKLDKAFLRGADAVIVDLEDAVLPARKEAARESVRGWLASLPSSRPAEVWIRVNSGDDMTTDLRAIGAAPAVTGFVLAKTEGPEQVAAAAAVLDEVGSQARLSPLIETAGAVLRAASIAQGPRVTGLQIGEVDLCADAGITVGPDEIELLTARAMVVLVSADTGLDPPLGPVSTDFRDLEVLRRTTEALQRLGFVGRACIHPAQVDVVNDVYTPTADQVAQARDVLRRFEEAAGGVTTDENGRMVDRAVLRRAERLLALLA